MTLNSNKNLQIVQTKDGSHTIYLPLLNEQYHSLNGAFQESNIVYIQNGLNQLQLPHVKILEIGFGTGLNCLLSFVALQNSAIIKTIDYHAVEPFPLEKNIIEQLNYSQLFGTIDVKYFFNQIHHGTEIHEKKIVANFNFNKYLQSIQDFKGILNSFDLIYYDAFGPAVQPEIWTVDVFESMHSLLKSNGILVTYCAKGEVKRILKSVGFIIENLPGPPGKREVTRATKR